MDGESLIDAYLRQLGERIRGRGDLTDVIDELADHLAEATGQLEASGVTRQDGARTAIEGLGSVDYLANQLTQGFERRFAVPSRFTRLGGWVAGVSGMAWLVMLGGWWTSLILERGNGWTNRSETAYIVGAVALWVGVLGNTLVITALHRRVGAIGRATAFAVIAATSAAVMSAFGWLVIIWTPLLAVSLIAAAVSCSRNEQVPRIPLFALGSSWTISAAALFIDRAIGTTTSAGRDLTWLTLGGSIAIVSCAFICRWLSGEREQARVRVQSF